ncbi:MAG: calcium-binding protein [Geminicoccaceae bacterium]
MYGGAGDDTLIGGSASSGKNTTIGGDDTLYGGDGADTLIGGDGADSLFGGADDDVLDGGVGADVIDGGAGSDQVTYENSAQAVQINLSSGTGSGGDAEGDTIQNVENVVGSAYDDRLTGDDGGNVLSGGAGDDVIIGGEGDDTLHGGAGNDFLEGGDGADRFLLMMAQGNDVVSGGADGWTDMIELQDGSGGSNIGDFGNDWTVAIEDGAIEGSGTSIGPNGESHGWLDLAEDSSGTIIMQDGTEITFDGIEHVSW